MPSVTHEIIVDLFRSRPSWVAERLHEVLGVPIPVFTGPRIVIEVQLRPDLVKAYSWPYDVASQQMRLRCPTCLLIFTPSAKVAEWAARISPQSPGWSYMALVLGLDLIPVVATTEAAAA